MSDSFDLDSRTLRELYNYCWLVRFSIFRVSTRQCLYSARVAFMNVERQLKLRKIPFKHVNPTQSLVPSAWHSFIQSSLASSVPALCVQSEHILSGAPAAEAAMPNIRVIPLNWWSHEKARVVT